MKHSYLYIFLLFNGSLFAQNNLLGQWYLYYIEVDGVQQYSIIPNNYNNDYTYKTINFNDNNTFDGFVCSNEYQGSYSVIDDSQVDIGNFAALAGSCLYPTESSLFLYPYFNVLTNGGGQPNNIFTYAISGSGDDEILVLTNPESNKAVYGRIRLPESRLPGVWYLHSITRNGIESTNDFNPNFSIDFKFYPGVFTGLSFDGNSICNGYFGDYYLNTQTSLRFGYFGRTLAQCNDIDADLYESSNFSFFDDYPNSYSILDFNISNSGDDEILVLTDEDGDFLTYGRQTLSVIDRDFNETSIRLIENPVFNSLQLKFVENLGNVFNYKIYSIDGKLIKSGNLNDSNDINVEDLNSGLYFLDIIDKSAYRQQLKFIKK
ncbi:T9SS type A sorting domain-containing protein [Subsaxibacter sp. CAU 1640]|uniref:T9SS type A sorting domain-containing protein n=1 Tax=Subsaxibacter sp. CAU 1640 TaxID=2933271 RepID=UPI00200567C9|nr:T9SS type A sorting domain-containing protein [Subsaxibacter sp. CAU 1640]MCK7591119.1 T9SS type A sorting domain-containing protein [Subsaxibacter sp. CAU 1640]